MEGLQEVSDKAESIFTRPLDILVLMGGPSSEHDVSILSGTAIADALVSVGHTVRRADIGPSDTSALDGTPPDVVFIALHGEFGEDGQVQRLCEERGLPYIGSPPHASEIAMDKAASKVCYRQAGLSTPPWAVLEKLHSPQDCRQMLESIGLPCVLKPLTGGSSVDVSIVGDATQRDKLVKSLLGKYPRVLAEKFVKGRELTVGVLGHRALPVIEIRPRRAFYDYQAKYFDDDTEYLFEHDLDAKTVAYLQDCSLKAHQALGCRDISRSDFLLDEQGVAWVLETNTIPGFTSHSLVPKAAKRIGYSFVQLCEELVKMALEREGE